MFIGNLPIIKCKERDLLSTVRVYSFWIVATSPRVSFIMASQIYTPALETCTSLIMRSSDKIKSSIRSIPSPVKFPWTALRRLKYWSAHTTWYAVTSIVIFTIHETVMSEPIRSVFEGEALIEKAKKKNLEKVMKAMRRL